MFNRNWYVYQGHRTVGYRSSNSLSEIYYHLRNTNGDLFQRHDGYGAEYASSGSSAETSAYHFELYYMTTHAKPSAFASEFYRSSSSVSVSEYAKYGVVFGNGTAAESIDSYGMSGDIFTNYTSSNTDSMTYDDSGATRTVIYTLTNNGTEDFTISEIGLMGYACLNYYSNSSKQYYNNFLFERTLLETPITIPAGGVGQVTYAIRMNYPTA